MRILAVLLAGCGFQVRSELTDPPAGDADRDPDAAVADGPSDAPIDAPIDALIDAPIDAPIDAMVDAMIDAPPMLVCPVEYTVTVTGSTSRYRISSNNGTFAQHHASCNDDMVGATHLVVFDTLSELDQITALLPQVTQPNAGRFYVGAVQMMNQLTPSAGWVHFTGGAVPSTMWGTDHPDDFDMSELDHAQQLAALDSGERLNDVSGAVPYGAVCECDGKTIDPTVATHIP